jgi:hypothetical protein
MIHAYFTFVKRIIFTAEAFVMAISAAGDATIRK